jgi:hypothetical protein
MSEPYVKAGYDYAGAVKRLKTVHTFEKIAGFCGYESVLSVRRVLQGSIPSHPQGEAIYIMYVETFGEKPA